MITTKELCNLNSILIKHFATILNAATNKKPARKYAIYFSEGKLYSGLLEPCKPSIGNYADVVL